MDYKEKYEKALERARIWKDKSGMPKDKQGILDDIFPELKESEGERIRKWLIAQLELKSDVNNQHDLELMILKSLAWLEKQDRNPYSGVSFEYNGNTWGMCARDNGVDILLNRELIQHVSIEKQDGQKPQGKSAVEAIKEEKVDNANKVEPKFHKGDWIFHNTAEFIYMIQTIGRDGYGVISRDGKKTVVYYSAEINYRLWNIQDAKDGDVLAEDSCIFIIEKMNPNGTAKVHCCLFDDGEFDLTGSTLGFDVDSTHPATKEQREQLEKAMANAGWEFDFEKKELKKNNSYCQENCKGFQETGKCFCDGDCKAKIEAEQNNAWSEEDENILKDIKKAVIHCYGLTTQYILLDWLKSLKQRIGE